VAQPEEVTEDVSECNAEAEGATVPVADCESDVVPPPAPGASESVGEVDMEAHSVGAPEGEGSWLGERLAPPVGVPRAETVATSPPVDETHADAVGDAAQQRVGEPVGELLRVTLTVPHSVGLTVLDCEALVELDTDAHGEKEGLCVPELETLAQSVEERVADAEVVTVELTVAEADTVLVGEAVCVAVPQGVAVVQPLTEGEPEVVGDTELHALPVDTGDSDTDSVHDVDTDAPACDAVAAAESENRAEAVFAALLVGHWVVESEGTSDAEGRLLLVPDAQKEGEGVEDGLEKGVAEPQEVAVGVRDAVDEGDAGATEGVPSVVALTVGVTEWEEEPVKSTVRLFIADAEAVPVLPPPTPLKDAVPGPEGDTVPDTPPP
jgi:hypothetical protein